MVQHELVYPAWANALQDVWQQSNQLILQDIVNNLPELVLSNILFFLPARDIRSFALTSKRWKQVSDEELYWKERINCELTAVPILSEGQTYKSYYTDIYRGISHGSHYMNTTSYREYLQQRTSLSTEGDDISRWDGYLHFACICGSEIWVADLLKKASPRIIGHDCTSTLRDSIKGNNPETLRLLLQAGISLNQLEPLVYYNPQQKVNALHYAILSNRHKLFLEIILPQKDSITVIPALHLAAVVGDCQNVTKLLQTGCDVNQEDSCGCTPLWWALMNNQESVVKLLLINNARSTGIARWSDPCRYYEIINYHCDDTRQHNSAIAIALMHKNYVCLRHLLDAKANIHETIERQIHPKIVSFLHLAAKYDFVEGMALLVKHGLKINDSKYSYSALHTAAYYGNIASLKWLLENNAAVDQLGKWEESGEYYRHRYIHKYTPLFLAAQEGHLACMSLLLQHKANMIPNSQLIADDCASGWVASISTPVLNAFLDRGKRYCHKTIDDNDYLAGLRLLLTNGANPNEVGNRDTALSCVLRSKRKNLTACVTLLLEYGAAPNLKDAFHEAVRIQNLAVIKLLMESGKVNISQQDQHLGLTPLMVAVESTLEIFKYLYEQGASLYETNKEGETVIAYAHRMQKQEIIDFIQLQLSDAPKPVLT